MTRLFRTITALALAILAHVVLTPIAPALAHKPSDAYLLYLHADILSQMAPDPGTAGFNTALASAKKAVARLLPEDGRRAGER